MRVHLSFPREDRKTASRAAAPARHSGRESIGSVRSPPAPRPEVPVAAALVPMRGHPHGAGVRRAPLPGEPDVAAAPPGPVAGIPDVGGRRRGSRLLGLRRGRRSVDVHLVAGRRIVPAGGRLLRRRVGGGRRRDDHRLLRGPGGCPLPRLEDLLSPAQPPQPHPPVTTAPRRPLFVGGSGSAWLSYTVRPVWSRPGSTRWRSR